MFRAIHDDKKNASLPLHELNLDCMLGDLLITLLTRMLLLIQLELL